MDIFKKAQLKAALFFWNKFCFINSMQKPIPEIFPPLYPEINPPGGPTIEPTQPDIKPFPIQPEIKPIHTPEIIPEKI